MLRTNERLAKLISYKMIKGLHVYSNYVNNCVIIHLNITYMYKVYTYMYTVYCICNNHINCMP